MPSKVFFVPKVEIKTKHSFLKLTKAKIWKQPNCPSVSEWIKKMWCVLVCFIYMIYRILAIKNNEILAFVQT